MCMMVWMIFDLSMDYQFLVLGFLVFCSMVFSAGELALVAISKSKVNELVAKNALNAKLLAKMKKNPHKLLITVLITKNVLDVGSSAYAAVVFTEIFGSGGVGIATGVMTLMILVFGDIVPKTYANQHMSSVALFMARPIWFFQLLLYPVVWFLELVSKLVNKIFGDSNGYTVTEGELVAMVQIGAQEGAIEKHERELIENVLEFNDIEVADVMTPRVDIEALDVEMTLQEAVDYAIKHSHSRLPVYEDDMDNIVGIIPIKELLKYFDKYSASKKLKNLKLSKPLEVPESKKINKLFREFQKKHIHIAIVIDEFGGTAGLVTLEDLLEEIVGEIVDEFDLPELPLEIIDKNTVIVDGSTEVDSINDFFQVKFWPHDHDTISGMVTDFLHRFPREGEVVKFPRGNVLVMKMDKNVIKKAKITKKEAKPEA